MRFNLATSGKPDLKHGDCGPKQRVEVLPVAEDVVAHRLAKLAPEQIHAQYAAGN